MDIHVYSEHPVADLWIFTSILNTRLPIPRVLRIDLCQSFVLYACSYTSVSIPRVLRVSYGPRWGPPHDGQKSVPSELQEARFADQISRRHFLGFLGSPSGPPLGLGAWIRIFT